MTSTTSEISFGAQDMVCAPVNFSSENSIHPPKFMYICGYENPRNTVVGASTMYWGITQCKNDNMTVLLVVTSTVLVVAPPIRSADRRYFYIFVHEHILSTVPSTPQWSYSVTNAHTHAHTHTTKLKESRMCGEQAVLMGGFPFKA